ncbi:MAG: glycosyltransferase [Chloroflexota bacterium]
MAGYNSHSTFPVSNLPILTENLPNVTVQLPIFNERHVIERLIDACAQLQYPSRKMRIQILDDSTDQTTAIARKRSSYWQERGISIEVLNRGDRSGYKGGALAHGLHFTADEYIAIFDADFVPPGDFLLRTIPYLVQNPQAGFVQTRWGHLNRSYSPLTRSQALALDGHFLIEQVGRQSAGYAFGFNGSGGIWRRSCITDPEVGGWQTDTLTEDLDLSYRAQLAGWQPIFTPSIVAPAEIPPQLSAFKRQQFRWAKGSIQTLRKCGRQVWQSKWPFAKRCQGVMHLGAYLLHPLLLIILLITLPGLLLNIDPAWPLAYLSLASVGPPLLYAVAQKRLYPKDWLKNWSYIWLITLMGFGICLNNSLAVWQALQGKAGHFMRTPKFHIQSNLDEWHHSAYRLPVEPVFFGEVGLFVYALFTTILALLYGKVWTALFMLLYVGGFGMMIGIELWQAVTSTIRVSRSELTAISNNNSETIKHDRIGAEQI